MKVKFCRPAGGEITRAHGERQHCAPSASLLVYLHTPSSHPGIFSDPSLSLSRTYRHPTDSPMTLDHTISALGFLKPIAKLVPVFGSSLEGVVDVLQQACVLAQVRNRRFLALSRTADRKHRM